MLGQIERVMRKSAAVDKIIKNGIRQLIADYPDKYYFKSYLEASCSNVECLVLI